MISGLIELADFLAQSAPGKPRFAGSLWVLLTTSSQTASGMTRVCRLSGCAGQPDHQGIGIGGGCLKASLKVKLPGRIVDRMHQQRTDTNVF